MVNDLTIHAFGDLLEQQMSFKDALRILQERELLNAGELAEQAVSAYTGVKQYARCSVGADLENGWEIKHGQTHESGKNNTARRAYVAGLKNKYDLIRVIITETLTGKLYYFKIPYAAYKDYSDSSLCFPFSKDGTPMNDSYTVTRPNYWDYRVESFEELCT